MTLSQVKKPRFPECLQFRRRGSFLHLRHIPTILICRIDPMPCEQQYLIVQKGLWTIQVSWQYEMAEKEKLLEYHPVVTADQQYPLILGIGTFKICQIQYSSSCLSLFQLYPVLSYCTGQLEASSVIIAHSVWTSSRITWLLSPGSASHF